VRSLVLFNNRSGVGKTTLTFNIAHMAARSGLQTVVLDVDPQSDISSIFLGEEKLAGIWEQEERVPGGTVAGCVDPVRRGTGDVLDPSLIQVADDLWLLPGHLSLSRFEQTLAEEWPGSSSKERALDVTASLDLLANKAAAAVEADWVMIDVGPGLGALSRAALLACDDVIIPLAPDFFSLQSLKDIGPALQEWRRDWRAVRERHAGGRAPKNLPGHLFSPLGYVVQQDLARGNRPAVGSESWVEQIPSVFHEYVLEESFSRGIDEDLRCLAQLRHYASLVPLAQIARKPMFDLKRADGIGSGQLQTVAKFRTELEALVQKIAGPVG